MKINNIIATRRPLDEKTDEFVILNQDGEVLASVKGDNNITLSLIYNEIEFVCPIQAKMSGEDCIYITVKSLKAFVK